MVVVRVLYATETGNALAAAERIVREVEARGGGASMASMEECESAASLCESDAGQDCGGSEGARRGKVVVFVASTCGQGEPPRPMRRLWRSLLRRALRGDALRSVSIAVFGLGDSAYVNSYNTVAKKLYRRLLQLGAEPLVALGLGDEQAQGGYELALDPWLDTLWMKLGLATGKVDARALLGLVKVRARVDGAGQHEHEHDDKHEHERENVNGRTRGNRKRLEWTSREASDAVATYEAMRALSGRGTGAGIAEISVSPQSHEGPRGDSTRAPAFEARVVDVRNLSSLPDREVLHIAFNLEGSGLHFEPGDLLSVLPRQRPEDVERLCTRLGLAAHDAVELTPAFGSTCAAGGGTSQTHQRTTVMLGALIDGLVDVNSGSPRRFFFQMLAQFTRSDVERERLAYFATTTDGREDLYLYNERERRTLLEVLDDFPDAMPPLEWLLEAAPRLRTRLFSIASSPRVFPGEAHIAAAVVRVTTPYKRHRSGLCTSYLASVKVGDLVPVSLEPSSFQPPPGDAPLILVGPGTGVAPFRSFVQDIHGAADCDPPAEGAATPRMLVLFFGCRNRDGDYLYGDEWERRARDGHLRLFTAFSRDHGKDGENHAPASAHKKTYVTHRIREAGSLLWRLLAEQGAHVYVSGSSTKMPADVLDAFVDVARAHGGFSGDADARAWVRGLERQGRYHVESWS